MRSRYSAYAVGEVDYILATTHPDSPHFQADTAAWKSDVRRFCQQTTFERLTVEHAEEGDGAAQVRFHAALKQGTQDASFTEQSQFYRVGGAWLYFAAVT